MKGDFSRNTFQPSRHYSNVLMQQGRVLLESDWNEQGAISLHYVRSLAKDLIGPYGGPITNCAFKVIVKSDDSELKQLTQPFPDAAFKRNFVIGLGHYYVDGLLCENERFRTYAQLAEPNAQTPFQEDHVAKELADGFYLVYLDVWERHVTALEDEEIREVALGPQGPDTTTRAKIIWQVRTVEVDNNVFKDLESANTIPQGNQPIHKGWLDLLKTWQPPKRGLLRAKADEPDDPSITNPCLISPDARYRGAENQLYRVEVHEGGAANKPATFKWSRENGSVALPVRSGSEQKLTLEHLGRDARFSVQVGDWVEIESPGYETKDFPSAPPLLQVQEVNYIDMTVKLDGAAPGADGRRVLRRWDQKAGDPRVGGLELRNGAAIIKEGPAGGAENWLNLEDGIKIQFEQQADTIYRRGDYWLIPARTATGDVEWPGPVGNPVPLPPHGEHHYAPIARITVDPGEIKVVADLRRKFKSLTEFV